MVEKTLREQVLTFLKQKGPLNVSEIVRLTVNVRSNVKHALDLAKRRGHVKDSFMKLENPWGGHVLAHVYQITKAGEAWLKER